jgi:hypothetical protein
MERRSEHIPPIRANTLQPSEGNELFRQVFFSTDDAILVMNAAGGEFLDANPRALIVLAIVNGLTQTFGKNICGSGLQQQSHRRSADRHGQGSDSLYRLLMRDAAWLSMLGMQTTRMRSISAFPED